MPHQTKLEARSLPNYGDRVRVHRACSIAGCRGCVHCSSFQCKGREPAEPGVICSRHNRGKKRR
jgi:hypothetical protein